jgi:DNA-binding LytR/AlgR family response regulator
VKPQWQARRVTALIAEDEPMLRAQLRARLLQAWPELEIVAEAENGEQALALAAELEPEIAFLDIRMPVKDGLDVAAAIGDACHVVFVTAYDEYAVNAFEQGAVDYVLKPVTPERVTKLVDRLKQRLASPPADLSEILQHLAARASTGSLRWIKASLGATMKLIPVDENLLFPRGGQLYPRRHCRRRRADPQDAQGAVRGARPGILLAGTSGNDRQSASDRPRRAR